MPQEVKVRFSSTEQCLYLKNRKQLKLFIATIFRKEAMQLESLHYIFCSDNQLLQINKEFLKHDYFTDIITFNLSDTKAIIGEIYISLDRVRENARLHSTTIINELHRVMFHGVLHLCGYDDKSNNHKVVMTRMENKYLELYFQ